MTAEDVAVETQPQKNEGEKKNVFERVKLRFSSRSKKQKTAKELDTADSMQEVSLTDKDATDINEKTGKKSTGIEKVKEILKKQQKEERGDKFCTRPPTPWLVIPAGNCAGHRRTSPAPSLGSTTTPPTKSRPTCCISTSSTTKWRPVR